MTLQRIKAADAISRLEFHRRLREWVEKSDCEKVGNYQEYGQTPWVFVIFREQLFKLNADTSREAVCEYLKVVEQFGEDLAWTIVSNQRGNENAVAYGPDKYRLTSFYFYLVAAS